MTKLHKLNQLGQAVWFDYIRRSFIASGELRKWVDVGVRGVTSNPAIFEKAIAGNNDYDEDIRELAADGKSVEEIYESLAFEDIRSAADILRSVYDESKGTDGYVSLEVNPELAHDTEKTISEAKRLSLLVDRPNVMIKIPATPDGIPAVETAISQGVNVNVTLIFSLSQYVSVAQAYIAGLEKLQATGGDVSKSASVASFFVSRVDTAVDAALEKVGNSNLKGRIAVDNAKLAYARFGEIFTGERWEKLARAGAHVQRPLWASTGTKNPQYSDTLYVDNLIGPDTVNTVPPATLEAYMDHGLVAPSVRDDIAGAHARAAELEGLGINLDAITDKLLDEGVVAFVKPYQALMVSIDQKRKQLLSES